MYKRKTKGMNNNAIEFIESVLLQSQDMTLKCGSSTSLDLASIITTMYRVTKAILVGFLPRKALISLYT
ncbi:hypothetical protein SAMN05216238_101288 [Lentibacillus persicus]|uniref:Uncharacterized protein n=1 Tax=Lentibacillus persicus TaxID=640948 RepID=A0A1I1S847_9BACI|nr:hypothetical protein SAMN05216238_101288 [Lentibacillus persicus]